MFRMLTWLKAVDRRVRPDLMESRLVPRVEMRGVERIASVQIGEIRLILEGWIKMEFEWVKIVL